jgi:HK97 family phage prohead protease
MKKTIIRKGSSSAKIYGIKALTEEGPGIFSAIVSVFGNVDHGGDRILAGAFVESLAEWKASGDPIPVVFSHQWQDPDAHVGEVLEAKELLPGDPLLEGTGLEENGGLWTKFGLFVDDPDEAPARRLAKRLEKRTIREFSFAYDVVEERRAADGANELVTLALIEVGPTLKGMNPATRLLSKALGDGWEELGEDEVLERLGKAVAEHVAPAGEKASVAVTFEGSVEEEIEGLYLAGLAWAVELDAGNGGFYALHQEASYPAELRAIVLVEGWDDPYGEGIFYELSFELGDDGEVTVKEASEIEIEVSVAKKARARKHRAPAPSATKDRPGATVSGDDEPGKGKAKSDELEEPDSRTGSDGDTDQGLPAATALDLELLGAGLDPSAPPSDDPPTP